MAFNENTRVKIPAILHLCRLGYNYVSLTKAKWDIETNISTDIFEESIKRINTELEQNDIKRLLEDISLVLDNENLGEAFYNITVNIQKKKQTALAENQKLTEMRDWLLPMLMNGQVKVN